MIRLIQSSALTKLCATLFLWLVLIGAAALLGWQIIMGVPVSTYLLPFVAYGVGKAASILGVNLGQSVIEQTEDRGVQNQQAREDRANATTQGQEQANH